MAEGGEQPRHRSLLEVGKEAAELGKSMELKGAALKKFVDEAVEAEKLALKYAHEQEVLRGKRLEVEEKRLIKEQELAHSLEKERLKVELEEKKLQLEKEVKMAELKAKEGGQAPVVKEGDPFRGTGPHIKLPSFNEEKDSFDAFLTRFENVAVAQKWPENQWAIYLSSLLTGKALDVIHRMDAAQQTDFAKVKETLMNKFRLTEEGFRCRFRNARPEKDDTPEQFAAKLSSHLDRWVELTGIEETYKALHDLITKEQFLHCCSREMMTYLKEKECKNMSEIIKWSRTYVDAHGLRAFNDPMRGKGQGHRNNGPKPNHNSGKWQGSRDTGQKVRETKFRFDGKGPEREPARSPRKDIGTKGIQCYRCGGPHLARFCSSRLPAVQAAVSGSTGHADPPQEPPRGNERGSWIWVSEEQYQAQGKKGNSKKKAGASMGACIQVLAKEGGEPCISPEVGDRRLPQLSMAYDQAGMLNHRMPVVSGRIMPENKPVAVLRDSGCSLCVVRSDLVTDSQYTGRKQSVTLIDGTIKTFPVASVEIDSPYFSGEVEALCMPRSLCEVVVGNIEGAREPSDPDFEWEPRRCDELVAASQVEDSINLDLGDLEESEVDSDIEEHVKDSSYIETTEETVSASQNESQAEPENVVMAVETRAQAERNKEGLKRLKVVSSIAEVDPQELSKEQKDDVSLSHLWDKVDAGPTDHRSKYLFVIDKGWLCRQLRDPEDPRQGVGTRVLVVPKRYRTEIVKIAHESLISGHLGIQNTLAKIQCQFYWPGIVEDVTRYCKSCDICQRTVDKGRVTKVPLGKMPLIEVPFQRIAIDLVGPFQPPSARGHRYILTVIDYATRYPEALPLKNISTVDVAEALLEVFSRLGFPLEMLSDLGTQFVSELMKEVSRLISVKQIYCTRYNPKNNGLVEKYNGLIKKILIRMCHEQPRQWDRYLPALLFALREMPTSSLGFSPFELLYGRNVRGPMSLVREMWTRETDQVEAQSEYQYVLDLKERLCRTWNLAHEQLGRMATKYKEYYDRKSKPRQLKVGDKVLVLLPTEHNKLLLRWKGPYPVVERKYEYDYVVATESGRKTYHINLLKKYFEREEPQQTLAGCIEQVRDGDGLEGSAEEIDWVGDGSDPELDEVCEQYIVPLPSPIQQEFVQQVKVGPELDKDQEDEVWNLLYKYQDVFTDVPKRTSLTTCKINLTTDKAVRSKPYPVPQAMRETIRKEIEDMLRLGVIERSESPYGHPIVIVKKADGGNRFCIDFRQLNKVTVFDPEPIPNPQDLFAQLAQSKWYSKIDLTKGYWQLPLEEADKEKTAFLTPEGKFQFRYMPFGLMTAGAQFTKLMRMVLKGIPKVVSYIDDILIHTSTLQEHLQVVERVLDRLRSANLGAKPSKCCIAFQSVEFLGHEVGEGTRKASPKLLGKIADTPRPTTKKQIRAFLGLTGFFRDYIPSYADIALPLTDLTKKGLPEKVKWGTEQDQSFCKLKKCLEEPPILRIADFDSLFILKVDASDTGLGSALMQVFEGREFPVAFASKKLLPRECRYATIEKECLAIVWAVKHFEFYLYGRYFEVHTDHKPLLFLLEKRSTSRRLLRWAMVLQQYRFKVVAVPGKTHWAADWCSRRGHPS